MDTLFGLLRSFSAPNIFNPWTDTDPTFDLPDQGPRERCARLRAHLETDPLLLLIGEAPGFRGCRVTGLGFTSERLVIAGAVPRATTNGARISSRPVPFSEPSASIVWGALYRQGLAERTVLWNAFAWHPHHPEREQTNRTPTKQELDAGKDVLKELVHTFSGTPLLAVGRTAERSLRKLGIEPSACVRHPAMGGANDFRRGLERWAQRTYVGNVPRTRSLNM